MDERNNQPDFDKLITGFLVAAVLAFMAVVSAYFWRFGSAGLSHNAADWAEFGEYVGGTLGGFFGLLAFIGVLFSMAQQRTQLDFLRGQANRDELQRLAATVAQTLYEILSKAPATIPQSLAKKLGVGTQRITVTHVLPAGATWGVRRSHPDYLFAATSEKRLAALKPCLMLDAAQLNIQLDLLARCLMAYRDVGGSGTVIKVYKAKARMPAAWLVAMDFEISDCVLEYYEVMASLEGFKLEQLVSRKNDSPIVSDNDDPTST